MKIKVFGCRSVARELYFAASFSKNETEVEILPHSITKQQLQQILDKADADMIVLAMGACRTVGLHSKKVPITAPKAHNCAALLLGSAERYRKVFSENEDSPVWINGMGCHHAGAHGPKCVVLTGFLPKTEENMSEEAREYVSDLSMIIEMLEQNFDESRAITVFPGQCIVESAAEIIISEPF